LTDDFMLAAIPNFVAADDQVLTGGQPTAEQLAAAAAAGVETVINLALTTSPGALPDERATVTALGLEYVHLPVDFAAPTAADYAALRAALDARTGRRLLVHCAANYRVSAFLAAYRVERLGWPPAAAWTALRQVWDPDPTWRALLRELPPGDEPA
jgi:protein tyrosine phosphatase (PTP) superfamily phosphohydrolase (DUF442 family)